MKLYKVELLIHPKTSKVFYFSEENADLPFKQTQRYLYIENQLLLNIKLNRGDWRLLFYDSYQLMTKKDINHFKGQQKPVS